MLTIAHRGAKGYAPENTLSAFKMAIEMGSDGIELDVHKTADGHIVVIHDETIDRTTNGKGFVKNFTLNQIKEYQIGTEQIPLLSEVLDLVNTRFLVNIELKGEATALPVVEIIQNYVATKNWDYNFFLVSSFDWNALQEVRDLDPQIPIGVLTATDLELAIGFSKFIKAETIHPHFHLLNAENTVQMKHEGFGVFAWTINGPEDIELVKSYQVNAIITDFPDRI